MKLGKFRAKFCVVYFSLANMDARNSQIPELLAPHVRIKNFEDVTQKISLIRARGKDHLQVISDFDRTLSRHHFNGVPTKSSYGVFESIPSLPKDFLEKVSELYKKFRTIEDDPTLTVEQKIPHMEKWWELSNQLYTGLPYSKELIEEAVLETQVMLREGTDKALHLLKENNIPVLVFSAGLGDVVVEILEHYKLKFDNTHVISNFFNVQNGIIKGVKGKTVHVYNKNEHAIENCDYFEDFKHRENVILLGDSLGDSNMAEGVSGDGAVLKIGFLNFNVEEFLPQYMDHFDIVLLEDSTMDVFNALLVNVLKK